jgi:hypothetical protein
VSPLFAKLNLGTHRRILVLEAPASFEPELGRLADVEIRRSVRGAASVEFGIAFATRQADVDRLSALLVPRAAEDAILWFAYPKATSRRYRCDFNRDSGWSVLEAAGFETVRAVAIDADWSALRFRRTRHVRRAAPAARRGSA